MLALFGWSASVMAAPDQHRVEMARAYAESQGFAPEQVQVEIDAYREYGEDVFSDADHTAIVNAILAGHVVPVGQLQEFDAWLSFRGEFSEVLTAFRQAFGTDTSAAAIERGEADRG